jgi:hypothetical protein
MVTIWQMLPPSSRAQRAAKPDRVKPVAQTEVETPEFNARAWQPSVVAIESKSASAGESHGTGFIVDKRGLIATNLHVINRCTEAVARFADGATYDIAGYAAVDAEHDLALLALKSPPEGLKPLTLVEQSPARRTSVWAMGHPAGRDFSTSRGEIARSIASDDLPQASQRFLKDLAPSANGIAWLRHSAEIDAGSSGGPLLNAQGEVLGVNTWVDREAKFYYALPAVHVRELLARVDVEDLKPLSALATREAQLQSQLWKLSGRRLLELLDQARGMKWQPATKTDYETLQQLAWGVTLARSPDALAMRGTLADRLDELAKAGDRVVERLRREQWREVGQITLLNDYASEDLRTPLAGLVFFVTIDRIVSGDDGRRGIIATVAGLGTPVFLILEDQLVVPEPGAQCLVLGVNYRGRTAEWGDNPLKLIQAPLILPGALVELK